MRSGALALTPSLREQYHSNGETWPFRLSSIFSEFLLKERILHECYVTEISVCRACSFY